MQITAEILDRLSLDARQAERMRLNYDLRTSPDDNSQRMLNALEPGTRIPIHRHSKSSETVCVLRGAIKQNFFDDNANLTESLIIRAGSDCSIVHIPQNTWHNSESLESGTIIFEAKDGAFVPLSEEDIIAQ